jgi:hypothetical protein
MVRKWDTGRRDAVRRWNRVTPFNHPGWPNLAAWECPSISAAARLQLGNVGSLNLDSAGPAEWSPRAISDLYCCAAVPVKPEPGEPITVLFW